MTTRRRKWLLIDGNLGNTWALAGHLKISVEKVCSILEELGLIKNILDEIEPCWKPTLKARKGCFVECDGKNNLDFKWFLKRTVRLLRAHKMCRECNVKIMI